MKLLAALTVPAMVLGLTALTVAPANAHTPAITADCDGVRLAATAYDAGQANRWSVTIDGVTQSGTFGNSLDQTFPVPQNGAVVAWSATVEGFDGNYHADRSGTVGPCGTVPPVDVCVDMAGDQPEGTACTPPPDVERSDAQRLEGCDVSFEGREYGAGVLTYDQTWTDTFVFNPTTNLWDLVTDTTATIANVEFTPWSHEQQVDNDCVTAPPQPPAHQTETSSTRIDCDDEVRVTETVVTTTPYVLDEGTGSWVPGQPVSETTTEETPVSPAACDDEVEVEVEGAQSSVLPHPAATTGSSTKVPTTVDAGLAPASAGPAVVTTAAGTTAGGLPGGLALLLGGGLLLASGATRKRAA